MHTLLLADDSVTIQRVVKLTFAGQPFEVVVVADGQDAIERMASLAPDVVLADTNMPRADGYAVAHWMRQQPHLHEVPVLLLSGAHEPVDEQRLQSSGANGVLEKPFEPTHVISRVKELLGMKGAAPESSGRLVTTPDPKPAHAEDPKPARAEKETTATAGTPRVGSSAAADAFASLLAAEENGPAAVAAFEAAANTPAEIPDEVLDTIAARVVEKVQPEQMKDDLQRSLAATLGDTVSETVRARVDIETKAAVESAVSQAAPAAIADAVGAALGPAVDRAMDRVVGEHLTSLVREAVDRAVSESMESAIRSAIDAKLPRAVHDAVAAAMPAAVSAAVASVLGDSVRGIVVDTSERLVREEIARIRGNAQA